MEITNKATINPEANPEFAKEEYKVRAMPGKLRPAVAPERARGILVVVLVILIVGGLIGGEVYLFLTKPDIAGTQRQMSEQGASLTKFGKELEGQIARVDSLEEQMVGLPSKEDFESIKTGQEELEKRIGPADSDSDSIPDVWEEKYGLNPKDRRDAKLDTDEDGLINFYEYLLDCDPTKADTDGDGYSDGTEVEHGYNPKGKGKIREILKVELIELVSEKVEEEKKSEEEEEAKEEKAAEEKPKEEINDTDKDGMPDDWEKKYGLNPDDSADAKEDPDKDGLTNLDEYKFGCDPTNEDTDGDGFLDGEEVSKGYNPAGLGELKEIEKLEEEVKTIEEKTKEAEKGILK